MMAPMSKIVEMPGEEGCLARGEVIEMPEEQSEEQGDKHGERPQNKHLAPRFVKGKSGNPSGRPKGLKDGIRARLNRLLRKQAPDKVIAQLRKQGIDVEEGSFAEALAAVLSVRALQGEAPAMKMLLEQTEVPLPKAIEMSGPEGGPVVMTLAGLVKAEAEAEKDNGGDDE